MASPAPAVNLDGLLVNHVRAVLGPSREALGEMLGQVKALREEWDPWLSAQQAKPWAEWAATYWVKDPTPALAEVAEQLAAVENNVQAWEQHAADAERGLTPRKAHRHGPEGPRREARALLHQPAMILTAAHRARRFVADVEAEMARQGPRATRRATPEWTPRSRAETRKEFNTAKTAFSPFNLGGA